MKRRTVLGMAATVCGTVAAGCLGSTVAGDVVRNETPLELSHDYEIQGTPSGTRVVVDVTAKNGGESPITPDGRLPQLSCAFLNESEETLHQSGVQPVEPIDVSETASFEFSLGTRVDEVTRYELGVDWIDA